MRYYSSIESYQQIQLEKHQERISKISKVVASYFGISNEDLLEKSRKGEVVMARGFVIYFVYRHLYRKLKTEAKIFRVIGLYLERDRNTIRHHKRNMDFYISNDIEYKQHHFNLYVKLTSYDFI